MVVQLSAASSIGIFDREAGGAHWGRKHLVIKLFVLRTGAFWTLVRHLLLKGRKSEIVSITCTGVPAFL